MFLTKLTLNLRNPMVRRDLASSYEMHRTLLNGGYAGIAKGDIGRLLFRVDADRVGTPLVLVQSDTPPAWDGLPERYLVAAAESKPFELAVVTGQRLRFRLRANPTKRVAARNERLGSVMAGKRVGLVTEAERVAWLLRKGEAGGFLVPGTWLDSKNPRTGEPEMVPNFRVDVVPEGRDRNDKAGHRDGAFAAVRFEGVLVVSDPVLFVKTVHDGVGSAKGFGFGLLSVAPA